MVCFVILTLTVVAVAAVAAVVMVDVVDAALGTIVLFFCDCGCSGVE